MLKTPKSYMVPKKGKHSYFSMVAKKPTFLILKMVNKSKKIKKKLPGLTYHFCLLQVTEKVNSLEVNEQKDVAKLFKRTIPVNESILASHGLVTNSTL